MRVLIGAIGHESNTFTPFLTKREDFHVFYGPALFERAGYRGSLEGIIDTLRNHGVEMVPTVSAGAMPGGVVERKAYEEFKRAVLEKAQDVDGVCLYLHGAMRAEGLDSCESDLIHDLRSRLGKKVPISLALDMHANLMAEMIPQVNALVAYHTAPHDDTYETGVKAAEMLLAILEEGVDTQVGFAKCPFLLPGEMAQTALDPMRSMMKLVEAVENKPDVLSASLMNGHCWADLPDVGVAAVVVTRGKPEMAQAEANRLAQTFWDHRKEFGVSAEAYDVDEAVEKALSASQSPVFLSDSGDNPGAGGTTDVPLLLGKLIERGAKSVVFAGIWDAEAVQACLEAGAGSEICLTVGGKLDKRHGKPLQVKGSVRILTDGIAYRGGERLPPTRQRLGPVAVLNISGIDLILTSTRVSFEDPEQLRSLGLEPLEYQIVVLKRGYLTTPFQVISPRSILAFTPGATNCLIPRMEFTRLKRPAYPLDPNMEWMAG
ncbi:MAG TPA: M81 family metallopeptidase [Anaerolineaceae bacterium]